MTIYSSVFFLFFFFIQEINNVIKVSDNQNLSTVSSIVVTSISNPSYFEIRITFSTHIFIQNETMTVFSVALYQAGRPPLSFTTSWITDKCWIPYLYRSSLSSSSLWLAKIICRSSVPKNAFKNEKEKQNMHFRK